MSGTFEHAAPLADGEVASLAQRWLRLGSVAILGPVGSGRRALAEALARRRPGGVPVLAVEVLPGSRPGAGWLLEELDLAPAQDAMDVPVGALAARIAAELGPATILVRSAAAADPRSLRVLFSLARRGPGVRLILIDEEGNLPRDPRGAALDTAIPVHLPAVQGEALSHVAASLLGARPTTLDIAVLEALAGGSFRALCWSLELAQRSGVAEVFRGRFHLHPFDGVERNLPSWSIREDLLRSEAAQHLALAGSLPVSAIEELGLLAEIAGLEDTGDVVVEDGIARLRSGALAWEIAERQSDVGRRHRLRRLTGALPAGDVVAVDAAELGSWWQRSGLPVPALVASVAVRRASRAGRHRTAARIGCAADAPLDRAAALDLVHSLVVLDRTQEATERAERIAESGDADELEVLGMVLALSVLRRPDREEARAALAELEQRYRAAVDAEGSAVLEACCRLLRPGPALDEERLRRQEASPATSPGSRRRALLLRSAHVWIDGRPRESSRLLAQLPESGDEDVAAVESGLQQFLRAAGAMLAPDPVACDRLLRESACSSGIPRMTRLVCAALAIYQGDVVVALLLVDPLLCPGDDCEDEVLAPMAAAISSIAASMLDAPELAEKFLDMAYELPTPSLVVGASTEHLRGIAATQLRPEPKRDEGLVCYAAAAMAARPLHFRLLEVFAGYRWAHQLSTERRSALWDWLSAQLEGQHPLDGVPGLFARMARGIGARDLRALVDMVSELQAASLAQDAKVLSRWLITRAADELPAAARRTVSRIARRSFDVEERLAATIEGSVLTPKEREVAAHILEGITDREIGEALGSSRRTVTTHVGRILRKLGLSGRHELTLELAVRQGVRPIGRDGAAAQI